MIFNNNDFSEDQLFLGFENEKELGTLKRTFVGKNLCWLNVGNMVVFPTKVIPINNVVVSFQIGKDEYIIENKPR